MGTAEKRRFTIVTTSEVGAYDYIQITVARRTEYGRITRNSKVNRRDKLDRRGFD